MRRGVEGDGLEALIDELAGALHDEGEACEVAQRAGFLAGDLPRFDTARSFWSRVVRAAHGGATIGGLGAIVEQARVMRPGNRFFAAYVPVVETTSMPQEPRIGAAIDDREASIGQQIVVEGNATRKLMTVGSPDSVNRQGAGVGPSPTPSAEFDLAAQRRQAQWQRLDEQRFASVRELHGRIVEARLRLSPVLLPKQSLDGQDPDAVVAARRAWQSAHEYFLRYSIFLPQSTAAHMGRLLSAMDGILHRLGKPPTRDDRDARFEAIEFGYKELSQMLDDVMRDLRALVGDDSPYGSGSDD